MEQREEECEREGWPQPKAKTARFCETRTLRCTRSRPCDGEKGVQGKPAIYAFSRVASLRRSSRAVLPQYTATKQSFILS